MNIKSLLNRWATGLALIFLISACGRYAMETQNGDVAYDRVTAVPEWYDPAAIDTLSVVSWNVEHFVDEYDNPYIDNSRENNPPANMAERRELLVKALRELDADVVVFQEFESDSYLQMLAETQFPELGYRVFAALESPDWYMNVVMISRVPLGLFHSYAHINTPIIGQMDQEGIPESQAFTNNRMWTAELLVNPEYSFTITGLHLKAGRGERNESWRTGQIDLLREHLETIAADNPDENMLVLGDLNTTPDSREFSRLLGDKNPIFFDPLQGTGQFSHPSDSLFWRIDHILPNRRMEPEMVPGSVQVIEPLSREEMIQISDHLPLIARFVTRNR